MYKLEMLPFRGSQRQERPTKKLIIGQRAKCYSKKNKALSNHRSTNNNGQNQRNRRENVSIPLMVTGIMHIYIHICFSTNTSGY